MHIQHNNNTTGCNRNNPTTSQNNLKQVKSKCEAEINYANLNLNSRDQKHCKAKEIELHSLDTDANKLKNCLPSKEEIQYAALDFKSNSPNTEDEINYATLHFHSDNPNKLKNILPKKNEIILNPSNAPNNKNEARGNDVTTHNLSVKNDNQHTQRKNTCKWLIGAVAVAGICCILLIAAVIVWKTDVDEHKKGKNNKHVTPDKRIVFPNELGKTTQLSLIQTHATGKQRNSASKPRPKCNFSDTNTFEDCYVLQNDYKTWHDSGSECKKLGMQLAVIESMGELNFVRKFLKIKEQEMSEDREKQYLDRAWKGRRLDPVEGELESVWESLFGRTSGGNQKEKEQYNRNRKGLAHWGAEKTWNNVFGEYYEPPQAYWISDVMYAPAGTPSSCMSLTLGYKKKDCQDKLPFICEYNK